MIGSENIVDQFIAELKRLDGILKTHKADLEHLCLLLEAGSPICCNCKPGAYRIEITFRALKDAEDLHKIFTEMVQEYQKTKESL